MGRRLEWMGREQGQLEENLEWRIVMEKLDVDTLRGRLSEAFPKPVIAEAQVWMGMAGVMASSEAGCAQVCGRG